MMIVKTPGINSMGKTNGCRNAGNAVISCLDSIYTNEQGKIIDRKLLDLEEIHVDNSNLKEQGKLIYENSCEMFESQDRVVFLGGDHSISFSIGRAFFEHCKKEEKEPCMIVFDAHADCMKPGKEPTHEEWLRGVVEAGFPAENILLVGNRNNDIEEINFLIKNKIKQIGINELMLNLEEITDFIMEFAQGKDKQVYVSVDIDVIDPAFAPSTGYKEPGGLSSRQMLYIISRIAKMRNLKGVDLVEVDSEKDDERTVKLASKILAELV